MLRPGSFLDRTAISELHASFQRVSTAQKIQRYRAPNGQLVEHRTQLRCILSQIPIHSQHDILRLQACLPSRRVVIHRSNGHALLPLQMKIHALRICQVFKIYAKISHAGVMEIRRFRRARCRLQRPGWKRGQQQQRTRNCQPKIWAAKLLLFHP